jgi:hypothetical protein
MGGGREERKRGEGRLLPRVEDSEMKIVSYASCVQ